MVYSCYFVLKLIGKSYLASTDKLQVSKNQDNAQILKAMFTAGFGHAFCAGMMSCQFNVSCLWH